MFHLNLNNNFTSYTKKYLVLVEKNSTISEQNATKNVDF